MWSVLVWFVVGWIVSTGIFYALKNANPDKGVCLMESARTINDQIKNGFASNFSNVHGECLFSERYWDAKMKFTDAATRAGAELVDKNIDSEDPSLTQTYALFRGDPEKFFIHLSGVHGVEGYAGSSIQFAVLKYLETSQLYANKETAKKLPTLLFVHAVNPFGFHHNRRTNEDNIDLNRNFLTNEEFVFVRNRDPNYSGYVDLDDLLNPTKMPFENPYLNDVYWLFLSAKTLLRTSFLVIKRAMAAGNYHKRKGYGFGGFQRSASANNLIQYVQDLNIPSTAKYFYLLDVHTGLGPSGVDTLMFDHVDDVDWIESVYPTEIDKKGKIVGGIKSFSFGATSPLSSQPEGEEAKNKNTATNADAAAVSSGYDLTVGTVYALCETFAASHLDGKRRVCFSQEFGTVPPFYAGKVILPTSPCFLMNCLDRGQSRKTTLTGMEMKGKCLLLFLGTYSYPLVMIERRESTRIAIVLYSTLKRENGNEELYREVYWPSSRYEKSN